MRLHSPYQTPYRRGQSARLDAPFFNDPVRPIYGAFDGYEFEYDANYATHSDEVFGAPAADGGQVKSWRDVNGNKHPLTQNATGPTFNLGGGPGGYNCVTGGVVDHVKISTPSGIAVGGSNAGTIYFVIKQNSWSNGAQILTGNTPSTQGKGTKQGLSSTPQMVISSATTDASLSNGELALGVWGVFTVIWASADSITRVNMNPAHTGSTTSASDDAMNGWVMFNSRNGLAPSDVSIARCIGYRVALADPPHSESVQNQIVSGLMAQYGIS